MLIQSLFEIKEYDDERFTKRVLFKQGDGVTFALHFRPGQQLPTHKHPGTDVVLLVVEGSGTMILDGEQHTVEQEDVICCSGDTEFAFHNTGNTEARLFVVLNKVPNASYAQNV